MNTYPLTDEALAAYNQEIETLNAKKKRNRKLGIADTDRLEELKNIVYMNDMFLRNKEEKARKEAAEAARLATTFTIAELTEMHDLFGQAFINEIEALSTWQDLNHEMRVIAKARIETTIRLFEAFFKSFSKTGVNTETIRNIGMKLRSVRDRLNEDSRSVSMWDCGRRNY